jgi:type II secretory pathway component PulM
MKAFWENRTERDRTAIGVAAILSALAIAYAYVWLPVTRERDRLLVRVPELRAEARALESDAAELQRLKGIARKPPLDLNAAIEQAAVASGITARSGDISQHGESARVSIASAQAARGFSFVARLQSAHGVRLNHLRMTPLSDGDRVKLEAVFVRAPQ